MAEINNFSEISENFDTIKTLLNSIRAQGILNTSDVDKLLSGINAKLEKINTEEDIDLIKIFLSELKQNLDERHSTLLSKFGAIESLFSNLLKNSSDMLKSSEVKELFDIIATNLSVFSREVVSQKETLTDITLRLDAMRSDDTQKKEIIKNISLLKNDLEKLNNGFDSIVLSLNENFKTLIKTISSIDQSEAINKFGTDLRDVVNSSNTILSALQVLDKKNVQITENIGLLATSEDVTSTKKQINELLAQNKEISSFLEELSVKSSKLDNLANKIDASVSIIANLKTVIADINEENTQALSDKLINLETTLREISTNEAFENFKTSFEQVLKEISTDSQSLKSALMSAVTDIQKINYNIQTLDINSELKALSGEIKSSEHDIKEHVDTIGDKLLQLTEVGVTRTLNEISASADALNSKIKETNTAISDLCEKNFTDVINDISGLKAVVTQIDENNVSANNAIFSNITDRLTIFENSLKNSLDKQEDYVENSSNKLIEQIESLKDISGVIDYKLDASVIQMNDTKKGYEDLKKSIEGILALDFVNVVKDLRVDLYASKQELANSFETSSTDLSDKISNDLFSKYELLISKLDSVEDNFKQVQSVSLNNLKSILDNISASIVDVLSYVSEKTETNTDNIDIKLANITEIVKDNNLNYVENVRDVVEVIRTQVENNLIQIEQETTKQIAEINGSIEKSTQSVKEEIRYTYNKLLEIQDKFNAIQDLLSTNNANLTNNVESLLSSADTLQNEFETKLTALKQTLLNQITDFKQEFTCENADKISELKFNSENLHSKLIQHSSDLKNELLIDVEQIISGLKSNISNLAEQLASSALKMEGANKEIVSYIRNDFCAEVDKSVEALESNISEFKNTMDDKVEEVVGGLSSLEKSVSELSTSTNSSLTSTLAKILENFVSLRTVINNSQIKTSEDIHANIENMISSFSDLQTKIDKVDSNVDEDLARQFSLIETNFEILTTSLENLFTSGNANLSQLLSEGLSDISNNIRETVVQNLEQYKVTLEKTFDNLYNKNEVQTDFIRDKIFELNSLLQNSLEAQNTLAKDKLAEMTDELKRILTENIELTAADYESLKTGLNEFLSLIKQDNNNLIQEVKTQLDDMVKYVDTGIDNHAQEINTKFATINSAIQNLSDKFVDNGIQIRQKVETINNEINVLKTQVEQNSTDTANIMISKLSETAESLTQKNDELLSSFINIQDSTKTSITSEIHTAKEDIDNSFIELKDLFDKTASYNQNHIMTQIKHVTDELDVVKNSLNSQILAMNTSFKEEFAPEFVNLNKSIQVFLEEHSLNILTQLTNNNTITTENIDTKLQELNKLFEDLNTRLDNAEISQVQLIKAEVNNLSLLFNNTVNELKESTQEKLDFLTTSHTDISAQTLQTVEQLISNILLQFDEVKQNSNACRDIIKKLAEEKFDAITKDIEKETDIIVGDIIEQFGLFKDSQKDEFTKLSVHIETSIEDYIYNYLNDLKSYLDVKTDNTVVNNKLDNLKTDLSRSLDEALSNINKLIDANADTKAANEVLITSMTDKFNSQIQEFFAQNKEFISENVAKKFDERLNLFDKKFVDIVVDKYEELKIISAKYNTSFADIQISIQNLVSQFEEVKSEINSNVVSLIGKINGSINELSENFNDLKSQILNKDFDEEFQTSLNNRISDIEALVNREMEYLEDISDLCGNNLPELTEMNTIVKYGVQQAIIDLSEKIGKTDVSLVGELNTLKSDIITQFLTVFNQISFVAEQEEILDFIQEKHSELITILSHIVTTSDGIETVKDNVAVVDEKLNSLKDDVDLINEKITSIMSSDGNVEYVYSLQDLESDIANLRLVLNDMKKNFDSKEVGMEEFKKDFDALSEDILSISTRTNKLILATDESNKNLQDNLQDFKLVINDLDERTRNFAHEVGLDKIDNKLISLNSMMQTGVKTNQIFNQVFEYLAEWVDKAGEQISHISDRVEALDDIGQVKVMLEDLKADAEDNTESVELIEALGNVFEKQAKKISSLEAKLDRVIVETTINSKNNKIDMTPFEETLNRFLVAIDDKMVSQQNKINSLEEKLEEVMSMIDPKDTAQLTKKVSGMDRQITKLNKSIEKIASHVVEK